MPDATSGLVLDSYFIFNAIENKMYSYCLKGCKFIPCNACCDLMFTPVAMLIEYLLSFDEFILGILLREL